MTYDDVRLTSLSILHSSCRNIRRRSWRDKLDVEGGDSDARRGQRWDLGRGDSCQSLSLSACEGFVLSRYALVVVLDSWFVVFANVIFACGLFSRKGIGWRIATSAKEPSSILVRPPVVWNLGRRFVSEPEETIPNRHVHPPILRHLDRRFVSMLEESLPTQ